MWLLNTYGFFFLFTRYGIELNNITLCQIICNFMNKNKLNERKFYFLLIAFNFLISSDIGNFLNFVETYGQVSANFIQMHE